VIFRFLKVASLKSQQPNSTAEARNDEAKIEVWWPRTRAKANIGQEQLTCQFVGAKINEQRTTFWTVWRRNPCRQHFGRRGGATKSWLNEILAAEQKQKLTKLSLEINCRVYVQKSRMQLIDTFRKFLKATGNETL
jgi:hypothetical protein